jgi:hypothetical protein
MSSLCRQVMNIDDLISSLKTLLEEVRLHVANCNEELCYLRLSVLDPVCFPLPETTVANIRRQEEIRLVGESHTQRLQAIFDAISLLIAHPHNLTGDRLTLPKQ